MADISAKDVAELRKLTGCGLMDGKRALVAASGDMVKAEEIIRADMGAKAAKKADRETLQGWIGHYVHTNGKIGVLVEVACETDFVAKNDKFQSFLKDLSMHICAMDPMTVRSDELDPKLVEEKREAFRQEVQDKPAEIQDKIIGGKLDKWFAEICLLHQPFVKDDKMSIEDLLKTQIAAIGENMEIRRFARLELGVKG